MIAVTIANDGHIFSLNNRRLYVYKTLRIQGFLENRSPPNMIQVRVKALTKKELLKYTIERCSLTATLMRENIGNGNENVEEEHDIMATSENT